MSKPKLKIIFYFLFVFITIFSLNSCSDQKLSKLEKQYIPLERVYSKIEAQMKKELQSFSKENLFSNLNNKFNVWVNPDFIAFE